MVEADREEAIRLQKDILVSAFYGLSKAAKEASNAAIDFVKLIDLDNDVSSADLHQLAEVLNNSRNLVASPKKREADDQGVSTTTTTTTNKKKKRVTIRDPDAPKRPLTAYFAFAVDARKAITDERKAQGLAPLSSNEMTTVVSDKWKQLDEPSKEIYKSEYKEKWDGYLKEKGEYETKKKTDVTDVIDHAIVNSIADNSKLHPSSPIDGQKKKKEGHESKKDKKKKDKKKHRSSDIKDSSRHE